MEEDFKKLIATHGRELRELRRIADRIDVLLDIFVKNTEKRLDKLEITQKSVYMLIGGLTLLGFAIQVAAKLL